VVILRRARPSDAEAIAEVFLASFKARYDFPLAHTDDEVRAYVAGTLLPSTDTWVVKRHGNVVGFISISAMTVEQLYVAPAETGKGIGAMLLARAKRERPSGLDLWTFQVNAGARRFYERHGFRVAEMTDGSGNEERQPDVRYVWDGSDS
jgi:GNAT superfamily N-acetyltransferase